MVPDLVAVGKGLAAGYLPISALMASDESHAHLGAAPGCCRTARPTSTTRCFAPPFIATEADIAEMVQRFGDVVDACL